MQSSLSTFFFVALTLLFCNNTAGQDLSLNMSLLGQWNVDTLPVHSGIKYNDVWGYADCSGREYAILGSAGRIHFIDVTKPDEPREVASFPGTSNSVWRDFKTYRDRAYACADQGQDGLMVFDLSGLPDTVTMTYQSTEFFSRSHNLWIDTLHGRLYMAGANTRNNGVIVFDIAENPDDPQLLASVQLPGSYIHDIHVVDHIGYASHGFNGLWVYDFTDPENPLPLGSITDYPEKGYNHSSWLSPDGDFLIMADETHGTSLKTVDVQDFDDIYVRSLFKSALLAPEHTASIVHNPFIRDQYVILAYYHEGIQVYDMSNPDSVFRVAYYDTYPINANYNGYQGAWGAYPYLPSGNILGSDITFGLSVLSADSIDFLPGPRHRFPDAAITTENPAFCEGSMVLLEAAPGAESYTWFLDGAAIHDEGNTIEALQGGYYQVEARNGHCALRSDSVQVEEVAPPVLEISLEVPAFCEGDSARLDVSGNADSVFLYRADGFRELVNLSYELREAGLYGIEAVLGPCVINPVYTFEILVFQPVQPQVEVNGNVLQCLDIQQFLFFQWYLDGVPVPGANNPEYTAGESGNYVLETIDNSGCYSTSGELQVVFSSTSAPGPASFSLFPNPASAWVTLSGEIGPNSLLILRDALGKEVMRSALPASDTYRFSVEQLPQGVYFYTVERAGAYGADHKARSGRLAVLR